MIEVEIKLRINNIDDVKAKLGDIGFFWDGSEREEDVYFDNASGRIQGNDQAFRVRIITDHIRGKSKTVMTFKGKKLDTQTMTRKELETSVGNPDTAIEIIKALGYDPVKPWVVKERENYKRNDITASIDRVKGLGDFLELEILIPDHESREQAMELLEEVLEKVGYSMKDSLQKSYLSMLQSLSK